MKVFNFDFGKVIIGENSKENWKIIDSSEDDDIWFHLKDKPSCHMILQYNGNICQEILNNVAILFKEHSKKCDVKRKLEVIYTYVKFVKKNKSKIGSVNVTNQRIITV
jgi:predicted ribosome quality control (RQC) complex YloA/Tae2 family protein